MIDKGLETMNISFIRGHVAQLTQSISQLALKPGEGEIKRKRLVAVLEMMGQRLDRKWLYLVEWVIKIVEFRIEKHPLDDLMVPNPDSHYYQQRYHQPCCKKNL